MSSLLAVKDDTLFTGTFSSGVWKRPLSQIITSADDLPVNMPIHFNLEQNYPNPFNPSTKIKYSVPNVIASERKQSQFVSLIVYDVLGNEVATLIHEEKSSGSYEAEFNANGLSSGIYFY